MFSAPIQQQLVESLLFSLYDKRTQPEDQREIDLVRLGQYRGKECRAIGRFDATSKEIRVAGQMAVSRAQAEKKLRRNETRMLQKHRKRAHGRQGNANQSKGVPPGNCMGVCLVCFRGGGVEQ